MTGSTRSSSSATLTGEAPGRVDSPPTSRMSAPAAASSSPRRTARSGDRNSPPSENESGVTLTIPMRRGRGSSGMERPRTRHTADAEGAGAWETTGVARLTPPRERCPPPARRARGRAWIRRRAGRWFDRPSRPGGRPARPFPRRPAPGPAPPAPTTGPPTAGCFPSSSSSSAGSGFPSRISAISSRSRISRSRSPSASRCSAASFSFRMVHARSNAKVTIFFTSESIRRAVSSE